MKYLTDRTEIGQAVNFGKYPVLFINRENRPYPDFGGDYSIGCKVRVAYDNGMEGMATRGNLFFSDENGRDELAISSKGSMLKAGFGRSDVLDMVEWAQAPVVRKGQTVVVVEDWPSEGKCSVRLMKVPDRIDVHCQTVAVLQDI